MSYSCDDIISFAKAIVSDPGHKVTFVDGIPGLENHKPRPNGADTVI